MAKTLHELVELSGVSAQPITAEHTAALEQAVLSPQSGASVVFHGVVRDHDPEAHGEVTTLEYTAHPDASVFLQRIISEVNAGQPASTQEPTQPVRVAALHRIGALAVGDTALAVAVASAHRGAAFNGCEMVVDRIKAEVPIWKKQYVRTGESQWVGAL